MQSINRDVFPALLAFAKLVFVYAPQSGPGELQANALGLAIRLEHLLLLDRVDSRDPSDRRLIEFNRAGCLCCSSEGGFEFLGERFEDLTQIVDLFGRERHELLRQGVRRAEHT